MPEVVQTPPSDPVIVADGATSSRMNRVYHAIHQQSDQRGALLAVPGCRAVEALQWRDAYSCTVADVEGLYTVEKPAARYVDGTRRLPHSPRIDTYLMPATAPKGALRAPVAASGRIIGHRPPAEIVALIAGRQLGWACGPAR
eukprot:2487293-Prymnesium_polylepis.1